MQPVLGSVGWGVWSGSAYEERVGVRGLGWQWGPGGELPMSIRVSADEGEGASKFGGG